MLNIDELEETQRESHRRADAKERRVATIAWAVIIVLAALAVVGVGFGVTSLLAARESNDQLSDRDAQITKLNDRLATVTSELSALKAQATASAALIGELRQQIAALSEQVRELGGDPVIVVQPPSSTTTAPPSTTTTTTTRPPSTTTTTRPCRTPAIAGLCIGGRP